MLLVQTPALAVRLHVTPLHADDLATADFERSVPLQTEVEEFLVDAPGRARVKIRIVGEDGRPLRFWATSLEREDRWERREGRWWIVPGHA